MAGGFSCERCGGDVRAILSAKIHLLPPFPCIWTWSHSSQGSTAATTTTRVNCQSFTQGQQHLLGTLFNSIRPLIPFVNGVCLCMCVWLYSITHQEINCISHKESRILPKRRIISELLNGSINCRNFVANTPLTPSPPQCFFSVSQLGLSALSPAVKLPPLWLVSLQLIT